MQSFKEWVETSGFKKQHIAKEIGMAPSKLSRVLKGEQEPDLDEAYAIERITAGLVPMKSWATKITN